MGRPGQLTALCLLLLLPATASAGPWTRGHGEYYAKVGESLFVAEGFRDGQGGFRDDTTYLGLSTFAYGEVGLLEHLQMQFYLPYGFHLNFVDGDSPLGATCTSGGHPTSRTSRASTGDALLGLQASSPWLKLPHALRLNVKLPMYGMLDEDDPCSQLFAQPGDGQVDVDLWVSLGESFANAPLFLFGELGHRFRTEAYIGGDRDVDLGDNLLFFGQLGWGFIDDGYLMLNVNLALPYAKDLTTKGSLSLGPALYLPLGGGWGFEAVIDATVWARNAGGGQPSSLFLTGGSLGVSHKQ